MIEDFAPSEYRTPHERPESELRGATGITLTRVSDGRSTQAIDVLAIEEPMEIRLIYDGGGRRERKRVAVTMRTPGNDLELALGFLFNERILSRREDFRIASHFGPVSDDGTRNVVHVELDARVAVDIPNLERNFYTTSSCGVCGKTSIEAIAPAVSPSQRDEHFRVEASLIHRLPDLLRKAQAVFESTGGLHAAALFTANGELHCLREDVGRHNALDKLIGRMFLDGQLPLQRHLLVLSGRASFELMQKASRAGVPVVVAIGAPSSLAVDVAREHGMTLVGFARADRFNVYSAAQRIVSGSDS